MKNKVFKRYELKYIITLQQMNELIKILELHMNKDKHFEATIRNIYYDTPNYYLIRTSIEKPEYKEKLRIRAYKTVADDEEVFVEMKKKFKKIVYKRREILPYRQAKLFLDKRTIPNNLQITKEIEYAINYYENLKPTIFLSYHRFAYIGKDDLQFRITFDSDIMWRDYDIDLTKEPYGKKLLPNDVILMEVKTIMGLPRWLLDYLGNNQIYKTSFSKYGNVYKELLNKKETNYA